MKHTCTLHLAGWIAPQNWPLLATELGWSGAKILDDIDTGNVLAPNDFTFKDVYAGEMDAPLSTLLSDLNISFCWQDNSGTPHREIFEIFDARGPFYFEGRSLDPRAKAARDAICRTPLLIRRSGHTILDFLKANPTLTPFEDKP